MGILSSIFQKIFPSSHPAVTAEATQAAPAQDAAAPAANQAMPEVDVETVLDGMPSADSLTWRTSIVDLLKLLGLDSSLQSRTALAHELGYTGNTSDSASMNIWLHQQVMSRVAANGGKVPANLM
jgi:hypothetical protein